MYGAEPYPIPLLVLAAVSFGGLAVVVAVRPLRRALDRRVLVVLTTALLAFSVVFPEPEPGSDLYVYAVYGRIIVDHGDNPYVRVPSDYPEDPWARDLVLFRDKRANYGPLFIGMTAGMAAVGGDSRLAVRVAHQTGAALAVAAALVILARAGVSTARLALVALNPVIMVEVVAAGRNDAYVGLALLGGALLASRRRPHLAALALAAGALIKIPAALALVALVAWVWRQDGRRRAMAVAMTGAGAVALAYLAAGGLDAVSALFEASDANNDVSVWMPFRDFPDGLARATGDFTVPIDATAGSIPTIAAGAALILGALLVAPHLDDRRPILVVALPVLAFLLTSTHVSSWYFTWILPVLALRVRTRAAFITLVLSSVLMVRYFYATAVHLDRGAKTLADLLEPVEDRLLSILQVGAIALELIGIGILVAAAVSALRRRPRRGRHRRVPVSAATG